MTDNLGHVMAYLHSLKLDKKKRHRAFALCRFYILAVYWIKGLFQP